MVDNNDSGAGNSGEEKGASRSIDSVAAEMNRKTDKLSQENAKLSQQLEQLMSLIQPKQQAAPVDSDDLEELVYKDPKAYAQKVKEQARVEAQRAVSETLSAQQQQNNVLAQLTNDYPELSDQNSELTQKAVEYYKQLPAHERNSPLAYKAVVRDAAAELGILPKQKRKSSDDSFSMSGSGSNSSSRPLRSESKEIDEKTEAFARLLGIDTSKKEVKERLKQRSQRKNWSKYE